MPTNNNRSPGQTLENHPGTDVAVYNIPKTDATVSKEDKTLDFRLWLHTMQKLLLKLLKLVAGKHHYCVQ